jgi:Flp pilus assembly protein TadG
MMIALHYKNRSAFAALKRFNRDSSGVVAIIFALAAVPIAGLAGSAVDYNRATNVRAVYQGAADAAALAAATSAASSFESRQQLARVMFEANMPQAGHTLTSFQLLPHDAGYEVRATGSVDTTLLNIIGVDDIPVGVSSVANAAADPLEISFVIDASRSMTFGSRWDTAYDSLDNMLTALDQAIDNRDDFNVTVVPMGDRVNIGLDRIDWVEGFAEDLSQDNRGRRGHTNDEELEGVNDQGRRGLRDGEATEDLLSSGQWEGCVQPREEGTTENPFLLTDAAPSELSFAPFDHRGPSGTFTDREFQCPVSIIGPSSDVYQIMRDLDEIEGAGTGRFDQGLAWGWRSVSPNWAGEWGRDDYPAQIGDARKVVVFISDGNSTMEDHEFDGHSEWGYNNSGAAMFDNFALVCEDMKDQGITIYTLYIEGNPYADEYFLACATSPDHYFDVTRDDDLEAAFNTMATSLMQPRLVY